MANSYDMNLEVNDSLERFITAQRNTYSTALTEIKNGKKKTHWMWFIFPQVQGLGSSEMARRYAVKNREEATAFLQHPVLGSRLVEICNALYQLDTGDAGEIFGYPDDIKLRSSLTLFAVLPGANSIFNQLLQKFFASKKDETTLAIIGHV